jgi:hypothetical protein
LLLPVFFSHIQDFMKNVFLLLFALPLFLSSCFLFDNDRPEPERQLPPITNEGAGTFGCRINGEVYRPLSLNFSRPTITNSYGLLPDRDRFFVRTNNIRPKASIDQTMAIILERLVVGDTMWLGTNYDGTYPPQFTERYASFRDFTKGTRFETWSADSLTYSGYVVLSGMHYAYDGKPRFIAGTFAFTARNAEGTQFIEVTEGRFDVGLAH